MPSLIFICIILIASAVAQGPGPGPGPGPAPGSGILCPAPAARTTASIGVTFFNASVKISSNQCPPYNWTSQTTPNTAQVGCVAYTIPHPPVLNTYANRMITGIYTSLAKTTTNPAPVAGPIGVALNGVAIFGNADADSRDAYIYEGPTFDTCGGHPMRTGVYHYHCLPLSGCGFDATSGQHSPMFGMMADGFPIFGSLGDGGVVPTDLDECGGHADATHPYYHYHVPSGMVYPYTTNCLRGCVPNNPSSPVNANAPACVPDSSATYGTNYTLLRNALAALADANYSCSIPSPSSSSSSSSSSGGSSLPTLVSTGAAGTTGTAAGMGSGGSTGVTLFSDASHGRSPLSATVIGLLVGVALAIFTIAL